MTTNKKLRIVPAVARLDKPRRATKAQKLEQQRLIKQWQQAKKGTTK